MKKNTPVVGSTKDWQPASVTITGEHPNRQQRRWLDKQPWAKAKDQFLSPSKLVFEISNWIKPECIRFRMGTITGLWGETPTTHDIIEIENSKPNNGHLQDVFNWFEGFCQKTNKDFRVTNITNQGFGKHLDEKRGFEVFSNGHKTVAIKKMTLHDPNS